MHVSYNQAGMQAGCVWTTAWRLGPEKSRQSRQSLPHPSHDVLSAPGRAGPGRAGPGRARQGAADQLGGDMRWSKCTRLRGYG
jgi:hypothetical protein